jgi:hypothetical protein
MFPRGTPTDIGFVHTYLTTCGCKSRSHIIHANEPRSRLETQFTIRATNTTHSPYEYYSQSVRILLTVRIIDVNMRILSTSSLSFSSERENVCLVCLVLSFSPLVSRHQILHHFLRHLHSLLVQTEAAKPLAQISRYEIEAGE